MLLRERLHIKRNAKHAVLNDRPIAKCEKTLLQEELNTRAVAKLTEQVEHVAFANAGLVSHDELFTSNVVQDSSWCVGADAYGPSTVRAAGGALGKEYEWVAAIIVGS